VEAKGFVMPSVASKRLGLAVASMSAVLRGFAGATQAICP
jgi:hypothetical protein